MNRDLLTFIQPSLNSLLLVYDVFSCFVDIYPVLVMPACWMGSSESTMGPLGIYYSQGRFHWFLLRDLVFRSTYFYIYAVFALMLF